MPPVTIHRTPWIDDDGSGTTGTVLNNAVKTSLYNEIDGALALVLPGTAGQIPFPATQVPSADPNTLDDYEELTFALSLTGNGGGSGQTYSVNNGLATKVGRLVTASFQLTLSNKGVITGFVMLGGFPTFGGSILMPGPAGVPVPLAWAACVTAYVNMVLMISFNTGSGYIRPIAANTVDVGNAAMGTADLTNTSSFGGTAVYMVG